MMKKILMFLMLMTVMFMTVKDANAFIQKRTYSMLSECKLFNHDQAYGYSTGVDYDYNGFNDIYASDGKLQIFNLPYGKIHIDMYCPLPNEYYADYYDQNFQCNQDNMTSVTIPYYLSANYGLARVRICDTTNTFTSTCGEWEGLHQVGYNSVTLTRAAYFDSLYRYNGAPYLHVNIETTYHHWYHWYYLANYIVTR